MMFHTLLPTIALFIARSQAQDAAEEVWSDAERRVRGERKKRRAAKKAAENDMVLVGDGPTCGDGAGPSCGNDFVTFTCGTGESCCNDDFNAWCCPPDFSCEADPSYVDPGGNTHCMTTDNYSTSCVCSADNWTLTNITQNGNPTQSSAMHLANSWCCDQGAESCGTTETYTYENTQTVSWTTSATVSSTLTVSEKISAETFVSGGYSWSITASATITNEQTTSSSTTTSFTSACTCSPATGCDTASSTVAVNVQTTQFTFPVVMYAERCGQSTQMTGTFSAEVYIQGTNTCEISHSDSACPDSVDSVDREILGSAPPLFAENMMMFVGVAVVAMFAAGIVVLKRRQAFSGDAQVYVAI